MQYTEPSSNICRLLEKLKANLQKEGDINPITDINIRIDKCNEEIDNLVNSLAQPNLGQALIERVNVKVSELSEELERLKSEKTRLQDNLNTANDREIQIDMISTALSSLKTYFKEMTIQEKRTLIKLLVQKMEWDGADLNIFVYGE
jgi:site-specific DNA recombinase